MKNKIITQKVQMNDQEFSVLAYLAKQIVVSPQIKIKDFIRICMEYNSKPSYEFEYILYILNDKFKQIPSGEKNAKKYTIKIATELSVLGRSEKWISRALFGAIKELEIEENMIPKNQRKNSSI